MIVGSADHLIFMVMKVSVFFSMSNSPEWLRTVAQFSPLTMLVHALRPIALDGGRLVTNMTAVVGLAAYGALGFLITRMRFKF